MSLSFDPQRFWQGYAPDDPRRPSNNYADEAAYKKYQQDTEREWMSQHPHQWRSMSYAPWDGPRAPVVNSSPAAKSAVALPYAPLSGLGRAAQDAQDRGVLPTTRPADYVSPYATGRAQQTQLGTASGTASFGPSSASSTAPSAPANPGGSSVSSSSSGGGAPAATWPAMATSGSPTPQPAPQPAPQNAATTSASPDMRTMLGQVNDYNHYRNMAPGTVPRSEMLNMLRAINARNAYNQQQQPAQTTPPAPATPQNTPAGISPENWGRLNQPIYNAAPSSPPAPQMTAMPTSQPAANAVPPYMGPDGRYAPRYDDQGRQTRSFNWWERTNHDGSPQYDPSASSPRLPDQNAPYMDSLRTYQPAINWNALHYQMQQEQRQEALNQRRPLEPAWQPTPYTEAEQAHMRAENQRLEAGDTGPIWQANANAPWPQQAPSPDELARQFAANAEHARLNPQFTAPTVQWTDAMQAQLDAQNQARYQQQLQQSWNNRPGQALQQYGWAQPYVQRLIAAGAPPYPVFT